MRFKYAYEKEVTKNDKTCIQDDKIYHKVMLFALLLGYYKPDSSLIIIGKDMEPETFETHLRMSKQNIIVFLLDYNNLSHI